MLERLGKLRDEMLGDRLDALLITDNINIRYLSGFTGSYAVLLVTGDTAFLLTDSRYAEQAAAECPDFVLEPVEYEWIPAAGSLIERLELRRVGFEAADLAYQHWRELDSATRFGELIPLKDPVGRLRMVKDQAELSAIREAVRIADLAYEHISQILEPGMAERDVALEIDCFVRKAGAEKEAFDSIVASGPRSALPHGKPTGKRISEGELVILDFGAIWEGYHSDITRTVLIGSPGSRQEEIYRTVLEAQLRAIAAIRAGIKGREVDAVARDYIAGKGYGEYFGHGLGHALGLAVHEGRVLSRRSDVVLQAGMVLTVEPGIYIPGWGGVRIEDDVVVTDSGAEVLTRSPKVLRLR